MEVPKQLNNKSFRFVKILKKSKRAFEKEWSNKSNYSYEEIKKWVKLGNNYGIIGGFGNLIIIDADTQEIVEILREKMPETFSVKTTSGGLHCYYLLDTPYKKRILKKGDKHFGEIQGIGTYVVGPNSSAKSKIDGKLHKYEVIKNIPIAKVDIEQLEFVFRDYLKSGESSEIIDINEILRGVGEGLRNDSAIKLAVYLRCNGKTIYEASKIMEMWNTRNTPPLLATEITSILQSAYGKSEVYNYNYLQDPQYDIINENLIVERSKITSKFYTKVGTKKNGEDLYKFSPSLLTKHLLNKFKIKTISETGEVLIYNGGIYHPRGEIILKRKIEEIMPEITKNQYEETLFHIKNKTFISVSDISSNPDLIYVKNGIFDISDMSLKEFDPELISLVQLPINYNPNADCPKIKKFLNEIVTKDNIPIIQEIIGYTLLRDYPIQKAFMFIGDGSNGKSVLLSLIKSFLGKDNISAIPLQALDGNRFAAARLYEKLANIYPDISSKALYQTGVFKSLTGGDMITAEEKWKSGFNFTNYAKLIFSCNQLPETKDESLAYFRRWIIIEFPNKFEGSKADKNLIKKLTTEEELSGLFNWAIEGLKRLLKNGEFTHSLAMEDMEKIYKMKSSPLSAFVMEHVRVKEGNVLTKREFYNAYKDFCETNSLDILEMNVIGRKLPTLIPKVISDRISILGKREYCWKNIALDGDFDSKAAEENLGRKNDFEKSLVANKGNEGKEKSLPMQNTTLSSLQEKKSNIKSYIKNVLVRQTNNDSKNLTTYNSFDKKPTEINLGKQELSKKKDKNTLEEVKNAIGEEFTYDMFEKFITDAGLTKKYAKQALKFWIDKGFIYEFKPRRYKWLN